MKNQSFFQKKEKKKKKMMNLYKNEKEIMTRWTASETFFFEKASLLNPLTSIVDFPDDLINVI